MRVESRVWEVGGILDNLLVEIIVRLTRSLIFDRWLRFGVIIDSRRRFRELYGLLLIYMIYGLKLRQTNRFGD